ncbi:MAG TPA: hypothetical protein ENN09_06255 [Planctomycetes bacterium]|nr:hypothetical protein [Planctomycetota bacterium]
MTGIIALKCGEAYAAVSYLLRALFLGASAAHAAFANAVGVSEKARGAGLGSLVHLKALDMLPAYASSLNVIISERQRAYHYYVRNGYVALWVPVTCEWGFDGLELRPPQGMELAPGFDLYRSHETELLALFVDMYGGSAGYYFHESGWSNPLRGFHDLNDDSINRGILRSVLLRDERGIAAYALVRGSRDNGCGQILEIACRPGKAEVARQAFAAATVAAKDAGASAVRFWAGPGHPLDAAARAIPGVKLSRAAGIYGQPLDAPAVAAAAWGDVPCGLNISVLARYEDSGSAGEVRMGRGREVVLAMPRPEWVRFVYRRLDLASARRTGMVSLLAGNEDDFAALAAVAVVPWVYLGTTYT